MVEVFVPQIAEKILQEFMNVPKVALRNAQEKDSVLHARKRAPK